MTPEDIRSNKDKIGCFYCMSMLGNFSNSKYVVLCDDLGEVLMVKRPGDNKPSPMVFCSSDCMVYESHLRYCDRVSKGTFRKKFDTEFGGDTYKYISPNRTIPENWQSEDGVKVVK